MRTLLFDYFWSMVTMGVVFQLVDHWLYRTKAITRRMTTRASIIMGILWPWFLYLLINLAVKRWGRNDFRA